MCCDIYSKMEKIRIFLLFSSFKSMSGSLTVIKSDFRHCRKLCEFERLNVILYLSKISSFSFTANAVWHKKRFKNLFRLIYDEFCVILETNIRWKNKIHFNSSPNHKISHSIMKRFDASIFLQGNLKFSSICLFVLLRIHKDTSLGVEKTRAEYENNLSSLSQPKKKLSPDDDEWDGEKCLFFTLHDFIRQKSSSMQIRTSNQFRYRWLIILPIQIIDWNVLRVDFIRLSRMINNWVII